MWQIQGTDPDAAAELAQIKSTSVAVISLAFPPARLSGASPQPDGQGASDASPTGAESARGGGGEDGGGGWAGAKGGFGHLIPAGEGGGSAALGVIYDSLVFPSPPPPPASPLPMAGVCGWCVWGGLLVVGVDGWCANTGEHGARHGVCVCLRHVHGLPHVHGVSAADIRMCMVYLPHVHPPQILVPRRACAMTRRRPCAIIWL